MKTNNKGFSYIELLIVLAIMAIMVGIMAISMGLIGRTNVNRGAEKIVNSMNRARNMAMAKGTDSGVLQIELSNGKYYCYAGNVTSSERESIRQDLVSEPVSIGYYLEGDSDTLYTLTDGSYLTLNYNSSTGAFLPMTVGGTSAYCKYIVLTNGDTEAKIELYPATGKCELVY